MNRINKPFKDEKEVMTKIKSVWNECALNVVEIRKAMKEFTGRLQAVKESNGSSIKLQFG